MCMCAMYCVYKMLTHTHRHTQSPTQTHTHVHVHVHTKNKFICSHLLSRLHVFTAYVLRCLFVPLIPKVQMVSSSINYNGNKAVTQIVQNLKNKSNNIQKS